MIRTTLAAAVALVALAGPALAHEPIRTEAEACRTLRRVGIIPSDAPARVVALPDLGPRAFLCLLPGQRAAGLRVRFTLAPRFEDEPRRVDVLGTAREPLGCATDAECEALHGAPEPVALVGR